MPKGIARLGVMRVLQGASTTSILLYLYYENAAGFTYPVIGSRGISAIGRFEVSCDMICMCLLCASATLRPHPKCKLAQRRFSRVLQS